MTFHIFGVSKTTDAQPTEKKGILSIAAECPRCVNPVAARIMRLGNDTDTRNMVILGNRLMEANEDIARLSFYFIEAWPVPKATEIPAHLPPEVQKAFVQAEKNYGMEGCEEPAALMYRRSLELAIGNLHPALSGTLARRIKQLVANHDLPAPIGDWVDHARLIGNEGAHEAGGVTRADLDDARALTDTALRYFYTLPAQISARKMVAQNA